MVWKILSGISAVCLLVAAYYANLSKHDTGNELLLKKRADENLVATLARQNEAKESLTNKEKQLADLKTDLAKLKDDLAKVASTVQEKEAALALEKTNLEQVGQQLTGVQKLVDEAGNIKQLIAQVDVLKKDKEKAAAEYAVKEQQVAQLKEQLTGVKAETDRYRDLEARARKGVVEPNFTARVAQSFGDWGFAVLNKGNNGGVFANADLDVKRGKDIVAKLKVRNVEPNISVVDIVPGSMASGEALQAGDLVVASEKQSEEKPAAPPADPAKAGATPPVAPPPAPGAAADPFAMGGAAAPAAATPAMAPAADPFAAPATPAAPVAPAAAPAAADPFAPAPAAGAGTKAAPSTADPFAPPAKP